MLFDWVSERSNAEKLTGCKPGTSLTERAGHILTLEAIPKPA